MEKQLPTSILLSLMVIMVANTSTMRTGWTLKVVLKLAFAPIPLPIPPGNGCAAAGMLAVLYFLRLRRRHRNGLLADQARIAMMPIGIDESSRWLCTRCVQSTLTRVLNRHPYSDTLNSTLLRSVRACDPSNLSG